MPEAMGEASEESKSQNLDEKPDCNLDAVRIASREADSAAIVQVIENHLNDITGSPYESRVFRVRMAEQIKRSDFWDVGTVRQATAADTMALPPIDGLDHVKRGDRLIILFGRDRPSDGSSSVSTWRCGVVPYSDSNLAVVRAGVAEDGRVPPLVEYERGPYSWKRSDLFTAPTPPPPPPWTITPKLGPK